MNKLTEKPTHILHFRPFRTLEGYVQPESIYITQKRYKAIREAMSQKGIVEIDNNVYQTSDIRCMEVIPAPKLREPQRWDLEFNSEADYLQAYAKYVDALNNGK